MQWLIDLIIEAIGIPPVYIDRGDPAALDFLIGDFPVTDNWTMLDLSGIAPAGAKAVSMQVVIRATSTGRVLQFRRHGNVNAMAKKSILTQVGGVYCHGDLTVGCDSDRKVDYFRNLVGINYCHMIVTGWWL
jgi:hypothetical protein